MIQQTTALRKIAQLKKRIWVIQGGQGAGKTFAILIILANHAAKNPEKEVFIASKELSKMRITVIKDFIKILKEVGIYNPNAFTGGTLYRFDNGSFIKFIGLDQPDIGKGLRCDIMFINEANKVDFETYRELTSRSQKVIMDFNPNASFWAHNEIITRTDADFLRLTYPDNEFISDSEKKEIELMKQRAYHDPELERYDVENNVKSKYWQNKWRIYGLGQIGSNPYRIFSWIKIPDAEYDKIEARKYYGVDWGTVDPWGIVEAKYYDGGLYLKELNYKSENEWMGELSVSEIETLRTDEGLVKWVFNKLKIDRKRDIICDTNRPMKISALWDQGYDYATSAPKPPGSIIDGISILENLKVYFTESSINLSNEQENYSRKVDRYGVVLEEPEDKDNHLMDCIRYIALWLQLNGILKN
jgi:phage terminase large subunit